MRRGRQLGCVLGAPLCAFALLGGCGEEQSGGEPEQPPTETQSAGIEADPPAGGVEERGNGSGEEDPEGDDSSRATGGDTAKVARRAAAERAERLYRGYVRAINTRDGERICALLAGDSWRQLRPPAGGSGCVNSLDESIGWSDRRGYPVWEKTVLSGFEQTQTDRNARSVRVTASVVTRFADRTQPSVESDVAYFERRGGGGWRLVKPSGILYRAVGKPEYPPSVLSPP
jgi:hypothetical protein